MPACLKNKSWWGIRPRARVYIKGKHPKFAVLILHEKALI